MLLKELKFPKRPIDTDPELGVSAGKYVGVHFDQDTIEQVQKILNDEQIPNPISPEDVHSTIAHSKTDIPDYEPDGEFEEPQEASINGFKIFNTSEGGRCLVATLDSDYLHSRHQKTLDHGATYDFDEYIPHVTLSYNVGDDWDDSNLDKLTNKYGGTRLGISDEYMSDLDPDWVKNRS